MLHGKIRRGTFVEHLTELRNRLLLVVVALFLVTGAAYYFREPLATWLTAPVRSADLIFISPAEYFLAQLRVALIIAALCILPFLLFQLWAFVRPGLTKREARTIRRWVSCAVPLFYGGVCFAFLVMLPLILRFLLSQSTGNISAQISYGNYVGFVFSVCIAFGVAFQLPVLVVGLTALGLLEPEALAKSRGIVVVAVLLLSALLTPPDVVSMVMLAGPLLVLFEASLLITRVRQRRHAVVESE